MDSTNGLKETTRVTVPAASNTLTVNVFTAPGKAMVGERPKPFGEPLGLDPITSTLLFGEHDAVLVDAMGTVAKAEALGDWVALHNRNLQIIYITHGHFDRFCGLSVLLDRFPGARAIDVRVPAAITHINRYLPASYEYERTRIGGTSTESEFGAINEQRTNRAEEL